MEAELCLNPANNDFPLHFFFSKPKVVFKIVIITIIIIIKTSYIIS